MEAVQQIVQALQALQDPPWYEDVQFYGTIAVIGTFIAFGWQLRMMRKQLEAAEKTNRMQVSIHIIEYLQREEVREARGILMGKKNVSFNDWSDKEKKAAEIACSTYALTGMLMKRDLVENNIKEMILESWENSISECFKAAQEMLVIYRIKRGDNCWRGFDWLANEALNKKKININ